MISFGIPGNCKFESSHSAEVSCNDGMDLFNFWTAFITKFKRKHLKYLKVYTNNYMSLLFVKHNIYSDLYLLYTICHVDKLNKNLGFEIQIIFLLIIWLFPTMKFYECITYCTQNKYKLSKKL